VSGVLGFQRQRDLPAASVARRRGIIATRTNGHFRVQADGTTIFYPWANTVAAVS
jgi:hypothetical protein